MPRRPKKKTPRFRLLRFFVLTVLAVVVADLSYLALIWPDWKKIAAGPVPKSNFMHEYEKRRRTDKSLPSIKWQPVSLTTLPKYFSRAVILAEDGRFYEHEGFDVTALQEAMEHNVEEGRLAFGASTISQQTVKNLFLSPARNPLRKWHEVVLTWAMERNVKKHRILEIYLNVAEFGPGIYGAQAAAQAYFDVPARELALDQAAELAATLPSPTKHNPTTRTARFQQRADKILSRVLRYPGYAAESLIPAPKLQTQPQPQMQPQPQSQPNRPLQPGWQPQRDPEPQPEAPVQELPVQPNTDDSPR